MQTKYIYIYIISFAERKRSQWLSRPHVLKTPGVRWVPPLSPTPIIESNPNPNPLMFFLLTFYYHVRGCKRDSRPKWAPIAVRASGPQIDLKDNKAFDLGLRFPFSIWVLFNFAQDPCLYESDIISLTVGPTWFMENLIQCSDLGCSGQAQFSNRWIWWKLNFGNGTRTGIWCPIHLKTHGLFLTSKAHQRCERLKGPFSQGP